MITLLYAEKNKLLFLAFMNKVDTPSSDKELTRRESIRLGLMALFGVGVAGCGAGWGKLKDTTDLHEEQNKPEEESDAEKEAMMRDSSERVETVLLDGNPEVGEIIFFRNMHCSAKNLPSNYYEQEGAALEYQLRIFEELELLKPHHIFREGLDIGKDIMEFVSDEERADTVSLFGNSRDETFLEDGKVQKLLKRYGGGTVYQILHHDEVTTYGIEEKELIDEALELLKECAELNNKIIKIDRSRPEKGSDAELHLRELVDRFNEKEHLLLNDNQKKRDSRVVEELMNFLRMNQGEKVVLTLGAGHNICKPLSEIENPPKVTSIVYPKLLKRKSYKVFRAFMEKGGGYVCSRSD